METEHVHKSAYFLILVIILLGLSLVVPAKWLGVKPISSSKINLGNDLTPISALRGDSNKNNSPDWRDLAIESLGTTTKKIMSETKVNPVIQKRLDDPNNLTASFSKNMYIASAYLQKNGGGTQEDQEKLVASIVREEAKKIVVKEYTIDDLSIAKTNTVEDKRKYGNALGTLLKKSAEYKMGEEDIELTQAYLVNKDPAIIDAFVLKRDRLETLITELLKVSVPYSALPQHLEALNSISKYKTTLDSFSQLESDPVRSTMAFNNYIPTIKSFLNATLNLRQYFKGENIVFSEKEPGYIFTREYTK